MERVIRARALAASARRTAVRKVWRGVQHCKESGHGSWKRCCTHQRSPRPCVFHLDLLGRPDGPDQGPGADERLTPRTAPWSSSTDDSCGPSCTPRPTCRSSSSTASEAGTAGTRRGPATHTSRWGCRSLIGQTLKKCFCVSPAKRKSWPRLFGTHLSLPTPQCAPGRLQVLHRARSVAAGRGDARLRGRAGAQAGAQAHRVTCGGASTITLQALRPPSTPAPDECRSAWHEERLEPQSLTWRLGEVDMITNYSDMWVRFCASKGFTSSRCDVPTAIKFTYERARPATSSSMK